MIIDSPYVAKRVQAGVPIWNILARGGDIGTLTDLPMEDSPMATVSYFGHEETFVADTIYGVLEQVGDWLAFIDACFEAQVAEDAAVAGMEYYNEVIAPMKAAEDRAEALGWGQADEDPVW